MLCWPVVLCRSWCWCWWFLLGCGRWLVCLLLAGWRVGRVGGRRADGCLLVVVAGGRWVLSSVVVCVVCLCGR